MACSAHPDLHKYSGLVESLGPWGVSGDESDHHGGRRSFIIFPDIWRNPKVTGWVRTLDGVYLSTKFNQVDRPTKGNWVRTRLPTSTNGTRQGKVVIGLPKNFYSEDYLKTLSEEGIEDLQMQPAVVLEHSSKVLRSVLAYRLCNIC
jgi:hypothetical protein